MARTGQIIWESGEQSSNQRLVSSNYFTMYWVSGAWPEVPYKINSVQIRYSKSAWGGVSTIYRADSTSGSKLGEGGSYWTGWGAADLSTDKSLYTALPVTSGGSWRVLIYGDGGTAGTITNGTKITITATWELTESASTFTLEESAVTVEVSAQVALQLNVTEGTNVISHKARVTIGGTDVLAETAVTVEDGVVTLSLSQDDVAALIPDSRTGRATVILNSYADSDRLIGSSSQTLGITIGSSYGVQLGAVRAMMTDHYMTQLLKGVGRYRITATPLLRDAGARVTNVVFSGQNLQQAGTATSATTEPLTRTGSHTYTVTATDSRGYSSTQTVTPTDQVKDYAIPAGALSAERCLADGTPDASGTCARVTLDYTWASGVSSNRVSHPLQYKEAGAASWSAASFSTDAGGQAVAIVTGLAVDRIYDLQVVLTDSVQNEFPALAVNTLTARIPSADAFFVFSKAAGKQYFGFGAYPTHSECVEVKPSWGLYAHGRELGEWLDAKASAGHGVNMIRNLLKPYSESGKRMNLNGQTTVSGSPGIGWSDAQHGIRGTGDRASRCYLRLGRSASEMISSGSMYGLEAGKTYTMSFDATVHLLGGTASLTDAPENQVILWYVKGGTTAVIYPADGAPYGTFSAYTNDTLGQELETKNFRWTFTVPEDATAVTFLFANENRTNNRYAAGDFIEIRNMKLEAGDQATPWTAAPEDYAGSAELAAVAADVAALAETSITPSSYTVPAIHCAVKKHGSAVHLEYYSEVGAVQGYDTVLLTLPAAARPSATRYLPCFFGSRSATGGNVGYGMVKVGSDGQVTVDLFSGLMHAGGSSAGDSTQTSVLVNGWYEV